VNCLPAELAISNSHGRVRRPLDYAWPNLLEQFASQGVETLFAILLTVHCRGCSSAVEHWLPKPVVVGSIPITRFLNSEYFSAGGADLIGAAGFFVPMKKSLTQSREERRETGKLQTGRFFECWSSAFRLRNLASFIQFHPHERRLKPELQLTIFLSVIFLSLLSSRVLTRPPRWVGVKRFVLRHSDFFRHSDFVIRHS
jgi:hypothetical protein